MSNNQRSTLTYVGQEINRLKNSEWRSLSHTLMFQIEFHRFSYRTFNRLCKHYFERVSTFNSIKIQRIQEIWSWLYICKSRTPNFNQTQSIRVLTVKLTVQVYYVILENENQIEIMNIPWTNCLIEQELSFSWLFIKIESRLILVEIVKFIHEYASFILD